MSAERMRIPIYPAIIVCALIGLCYLWTGSAYLTWIHRLPLFFSTDEAHLLSEAFGGYVPQAIGLGLFGFALYRNPKRALDRSVFSTIMLLDLVFTAVMVLTVDGITVAISGILMNFMNGAATGFYLAWLSLFAPIRHRGIVFGAAYACGSVGSYLISLLGGGNFLAGKDVIWLYGVFALIAIVLVVATANILPAPVTDNDKTPSRQHSLRRALKACLLPGAVVFLLTFICNVMFYFPAFSYQTGIISVEFTRAFYALGLIAAALINDKNRTLGLVMTLASFVFAIISLPLNGNMAAAQMLAQLGYIFGAFYVIFRILVFADLYDKDAQLLPLCVLGLVWGRIGEAVGGFTGWVFAGDTFSLAILDSAVFLVLLALIFLLYHRDYLPVTIKQKREHSLSEFIASSGLSKREEEVFVRIIAGDTNQEIATRLVITERTVKYHVGNILKKTACTSRKELLEKIREL